MKSPLEDLDKLVDKVLAFKPKPKSDGAKKRSKITKELVNKTTKSRKVKVPQEGDQKANKQP